MTDYSRVLIKAAQGLLETLASGEAHQNEQLLARAFQGWENDPRKRLRTDGDPATLATHWLSVLETARCIKGHSPLVRLLSEDRHSAGRRCAASRAGKTRPTHSQTRS